MGRGGKRRGRWQAGVKNCWPPWVGIQSAKQADYQGGRVEEGWGYRWRATTATAFMPSLLAPCPYTVRPRCCPTLMTTDMLCWRKLGGSGLGFTTSKYRLLDTKPAFVSLSSKINIIMERASGLSTSFTNSATNYICSVKQDSFIYSPLFPPTTNRSNTTFLLQPTLGKTSGRKLDKAVSVCFARSFFLLPEDTDHFNSIAIRPFGTDYRCMCVISCSSNILG